MAIEGKKFSELTAQQKADMRDAIRGYKMYSATISLSGSDPIVVVERENTFGMVFTFTRIGVGIYKSTLFGQGGVYFFLISHFNGSAEYDDAYDEIYIECKIFGLASVVDWTNSFISLTLRNSYFIPFYNAEVNKET